MRLLALRLLAVALLAVFVAAWSKEGSYMHTLSSLHMQRIEC